MFHAPRLVVLLSKCDRSNDTLIEIFINNSRITINKRKLAFDVLQISPRSTLIT